MVVELLDCFIKEERLWLSHKDLEQKWCFLGHLAMCYASLVPFLKGFHLMIDSWRTKTNEWLEDGR
jgi:hypothetical protein